MENQIVKSKEDKLIDIVANIKIDEPYYINDYGISYVKIASDNYNSETIFYWMIYYTTRPSPYFKTRERGLIREYRTILGAKKALLKALLVNKVG